MAIKVVEDGPEIVLKRSDYTRLQRAWAQECMHTVSPPTFEEWVRGQQRRAQHAAESIGGLFERYRG